MATEEATLKTVGDKYRSFLYDEADQNIEWRYGDKCGCTKFLHRMGHVLIHGRAKHGLSLCVWGMLSPKLYTKCGRPLDG
jgi:hypothetical protein